MRADLHAALFQCHRCGAPVYVKREPFGDLWVAPDGKPHINCTKAALTGNRARLIQPGLFAATEATDTYHHFYDDRNTR